ncbi:MAG: HAMP domain-containing histidine kinase [Thermoanaerobaculaceae bacterium]|jgi:signal transduction histidine kinase|nr:HAMP domain-containing histidine kinase [Thermoanaerobaculaceae bacterium]
MAPPPADRSPLLSSALVLVGESATVDELTERYAAVGASVAGPDARALLDELVNLGLARVAAGHGPGRRHVPTALGRQLARASISGSEELRDELAALDLLRSDLLSTIAHEVRTPLTVIRTSVGLLREPGASLTDAQRRRLLATVERNADRIWRLVDDLLDLTRLRSGQMTLQLRRFDASSIARSAATLVQPLVSAAGQSLVVHAPAEPVPVFGDHRRLEQALLNLVSNAQKYSPPGSRIEITVDATDPEVRWSVIDEGPGIGPANMSRLFERFFVGRTDRGGRSAGAGLGLPIAMAIAQSHGGRIEVESSVGAGSTFRLVIPAAGPPEAHDE